MKIRQEWPAFPNLVSCFEILSIQDWQHELGACSILILSVFGDWWKAGDMTDTIVQCSDSEKRLLSDQKYSSINSSTWF